MASFASIFIPAGRQRLIAVLFGLLCFFTTLTALGGAALHYVGLGLTGAAGKALKDYEIVRQNVENAFRTLEKRVTAPACSEPFLLELRRIAFIPDGLNEFIYAPDGVPQCSTSFSRYPAPVALGPPDVPRLSDHDVEAWMDRDLAFLGLEGLNGSIVRRGDFAIVVPPQRLTQVIPEWLSVEAVLNINGRSIHRAGTQGVYAAAQAAGADGGRFSLEDGVLYNISCGQQGYFCIATGASLPRLVSTWLPPILLAVMFAFLLASWGAQLAARIMRYRWSFEARFKRTLGLDNVVCVYQPIMHLQTGRIEVCEVLARWRDLDDSIATPDRFIPIVERAGLTLEFTELVAARAYEDLSRALPADQHIDVNFNIFPRDLVSPELPALFAPFLRQPERFTVGLEIVETDALDLAAAVPAVEALRAAGFKVFIDDFGAGYSSVETIVALPVDGVKLDRSFAMAPSHAMMGRMLDLAVEMIGATGRIVVVEGVETLERLLQLRHADVPVAYVQGYAISRPVDAASFAAQVAAPALDAPQTQAA